ncbi:hypothetical protein M1O16_04330 [Dehalococcoidia bacterium]|nr:hypothetical protein [Dehalococcoidia bacterium]
MISMLYLEMRLLSKYKLVFISLLVTPIVIAVPVLIIGGNIFSLQLIALLVGWLPIGQIASMKRYRQLESLFSLGVAPKDIFAGNLLLLGIYYVYTFLVFLPLYVPGIAVGSMAELRALFPVALFLMGTKGLAIYLTMLIRRIYLIQWAGTAVFMLAIFGMRHIARIVEHPYVWMVLPISLIAIAISYLMTTRLSKERIILSSE